MVIRSLFSLIAFAGVVACHSSPSEPPKPAAPAVSSAAVTQSPVIAGVVSRAGKPLADVAVSVGGVETPVVSDADGSFELQVPEEFAAAPAIYVTLKTQEQRFFTPLRNTQGRIEAAFELGETEHPRVELSNASADDRAWVDVRAWAVHEANEWRKTPKDDHAAQLAQWARVAEQIAGEPNDYRRGLMLAAQFMIGLSNPEAGPTRVDAAEQALSELGLDDPRWAIDIYALQYATYETGRYDQIAPRFDALISSFPQPEIAANLAVSRYTVTSADGPADQAAAVWQRWLDRPVLARTFYATTMRSWGPDRTLAPGKRLPELCVEQLGGGTFCTADIKGELIVLELWSTWCGGCRTTAAKLRETHTALGEDAPMFVSINPYDDLDAVESFLNDEPMPWRQGWVVEAEREAFIESFDLRSLPTLVLIDAEGTILASSPVLRVEQIADRVQALRAAK